MTLSPAYEILISKSKCSRKRDLPLKGLTFCCNFLCQKHAETWRPTSCSQGKSRSPLMNRSVVDLRVSSSELSKADLRKILGNREGTAPPQAFSDRTTTLKVRLIAVLWYALHLLIGCRNLMCHTFVGDNWQLLCSPATLSRFQPQRKSFLFRWWCERSWPSAISRDGTWPPSSMRGSASGVIRGLADETHNATYVR